MVYYINFFLVPLYYILLRALLPKEEAVRCFWRIVIIHSVLFRALANPYNYVDIETYATAYDSISGWNLKETLFGFSAYTMWGQGFLLYNWVISRFFPTPEAFFFITSVISVAGVMLFYKRTTYTVLATVLFYLSYHMLYIHGFGPIRQHLSIPFLLFALYYIDNTKKSLFYIILAISIHSSSIIFLPFYAIYKVTRKLSYRKMLLYSLCFFCVARILFGLIISYLPKYEGYLDIDANNNTLPVIVSLLLLVLLYMEGIFKKNITVKDRSFLLFYVYGVFLTIFCVGLPAAGRLSLIVIYSIPTVMSFLYKYGSKNKTGFYIYIVCIFSFIFCCHIFKIGGGYDLYNYYSFFWK